MKSFASKLVLLVAAGALFATGFIVWPGCASAPLPASRTPLSTHKRSDFAFKKDVHPTENEIVAKLGEPDAYFASLHVACYKLNQVKRRKVVLFLAILPIAVTRDSDDLEVAFIQYDNQGQAQRIAIQDFPYYFPGADFNVQGDVLRNALRPQVKQWLDTPVGNPTGK